MEGKTVLITGANSGIGKAAAENLARKGAEIIMVTRETESGIKAKKEIESLSGSKKIHQYTCDLSSLSQIRSLASDLHRDFQKIDVHLNNAGLITKERKQTEDGYEYQFAVNHLSHFLLTQLNIDLLRNAKAARIINVSSKAHEWGKIHYTDLNLETNYSSIKAYAQSKLANILFTYALCSRLHKEGITSNAVHPGMVGSRFGFSRNGNETPLIMKFYQKIALSPENGARTLVFLASSADVEGKSGGYYVNSRIKSSSKQSYDPDAAAALWDISLQMVGLKKSLI